MNYGKVYLLVIESKEHLYGLQLNAIDNGNITANELNKWGLHLNLSDSHKLVIDLIWKIKKWTAAWRVTGSLPKFSSLDFQVSFRSFINLEKFEKSDESVINQQN